MAPSTEEAGQGSSTPADEEETSNDEQGNFVDISSLVDACADSLTFSNPMLCTESFNLQDSMAAMELLDPKMDSCEIPMSQILPGGHPKTATKDENGNDKVLYPRSPPTQLDDDFLPLPWEDLTLKDSVFIAVEALVRLESMLGGSSVVESIYTCLYAHSSVIEDMKDRLDPSPNETLKETLQTLVKPSTATHQPRGTLPQHIVYATTLALVEITEIMRSIILHGDIYEEEDFCANTYNVSIYSNREKGATMSELVYASKLAEEIEEKDTDEGLAARDILGTLIELLGVSTSVARVAGSEVMRVMVETQQSIRSAVDYIGELRKLYAKLKANETEREIELLQRTFDPYANRPLFGNSPVRKVVFLEPNISLELLSKIVSEVDWALCKLVVQGKSLSRIRQFLDRISKSSINILTRSLIVLNLYFDEKLLGRYSLLELIVQDMQEMAAVPNDIFESKHGQMFLNRLAKPVYDTLKLRLLNRNRQRAYMEAVIIHDWSQLQQEAHIVDVHYRKEKELDTKAPPFISHYVLSNLVQLMDLHVLIGVELSLFRSHEDLAVVYWYRDFLLSTLLNNMTAMKKTKVAALDEGKNKEKNGNLQEPCDLGNDLDFMVLDCKRSLCRGLVRYIAALHQAKFLENDKFQFTAAEKVFQKRFEAFAAIQQPPPLTYDDFIQGSSFARVSQRDLLFSTAECFKSSKATIVQITSKLATINGDFFSMTKEELGQIAKVCVGNSVYIMKMKQMVGKEAEANSPGVDFDFEANNEFSTIKLAMKK